MKIFAAFLSVVLFSTNVLWAYTPEKNFWEERRKKQSHAPRPVLAQLPAIHSVVAPLPAPSLIENLKKESQPRRDFSKLSHLVSQLSQNGTVRDIRLAKEDKPTLVYIQDIHGQKEAQKNIAEMILAVLDKNPNALVALEGAAGDMPIQDFRLSTNEVNKEVGSFFLNSGLITGAEYAGFAAVQQPRFFGMEDVDLYLENAEAVQASLKIQKETRIEIEKQIAELNRQKKEIYSDALQKLDQKTIAYHKNKIGVGDYLAALSSISPIPQRYKQVSLFLKTWHLEKTLDFDRAEKQRRTFLTRLVEKLNQSGVDQLVQWSVALRAGRMTYPDYYGQLKELSQKAGVTLSSLPELGRYISYVLQSDAIQPEKFLEEVSHVEKAVWEKRLETPEQKKIYDTSVRLRLEEKLVSLKMTPQEWKEYKEFKARSLTRFESFYYAVEQRDRAMTANVKEKLTETSSDIAILVAGGFHKGGFHQHLSEDDFTLITVSPKLTKIKDGDHDYLNVFTREKTPLEKLFQAPQISMVMTMATDPVASNMNPAAPVVRELNAPLSSLMQKVKPNGVQVQRSSYYRFAVAGQRASLPRSNWLHTAPTYNGKKVGVARNNRSSDGKAKIGAERFKEGVEQWYYTSTTIVSFVILFSTLANGMVFWTALLISVIGGYAFLTLLLYIAFIPSHKKLIDDPAFRDIFYSPNGELIESQVNAYLYTYLPHRHLILFGGTTMLVSLSLIVLLAVIGFFDPLVVILLAVIGGFEGHFVGIGIHKWNNNNEDWLFGGKVPASTQSYEQSIQNEIRNLVVSIASAGKIMKINGRELHPMAGQPRELLAFIQRYSVLQHPDDIRRVLQMKAETLRGTVPQTGISSQDVNALFDAIFDSDSYVNNYSNTGDGAARSPINLVLFRGGTGGDDFTNAVRFIDNLNVTLVVGGVDDGLNWFGMAHRLNATGIPEAGKSLVSLARNMDVVDFVSKRIEGLDESIAEESLRQDLLVLVDKLEGKAGRFQTPYMKEILDAALRISSDRAGQRKLKELTAYLRSFVDKMREHDEWIHFDPRGVRMRSLIITGAAWTLGSFEQPKWQKSLDKVATLFDVKEGNRVVFATEKRHRLMAMDEEGTIFFSEVALKNYPGRKKIIGLWLVDPQMTDIDQFQEAHLQSGQRGIYLDPVNLGDVQVGHANSPDIRLKGQIEATTRRIRDKRHINLVAQMISKRSLTGHSALISSEKLLAKETGESVKEIKKADIIIYGNTDIETDLSSALIVPSVSAAIASGKRGAVKINLSNLQTQDAPELTTVYHLDRIYRSLTNQPLHREDQHGWVTLSRYVNYVLGKSRGRETGGPTNVLFDKDRINNDTGGRLSAIDLDMEMATGPSGQYDPTLIKENVLALLGIERSGFTITPAGRLVQARTQAPRRSQFSSERIGTGNQPGKWELGLFRQNQVIQDLIRDIQANWETIIEEGAFVFDVDKTLLAKGAKSLTQYPELANIFMRLLREGIEVDIISGNSAEEQLPRIVDPIKAALGSQISALANLTMYLNGGGTKIGFSNRGEPMYDVDYLRAHALSDPNPRTSELMKVVRAGIEEVVQTELGRRRWKTKFVDPNTHRDALPYVEIRGKFENRFFGSLTIKPANNVNGKDVREKIIKAIKRRLGGRAKEFNFLPAGSSSIDITSKKGSKVAAMKDILSRRRAGIWVYYFGDEFRERGNDELIARDPDLKDVQTLAVNEDDIIGSRSDYWIGRTPQATTEFMETVLDYRPQREAGATLFVNAPLLWLQVGPAIVVAFVGLFTPLQSLALAVLGLIAVWILNHEVIAHGLGFWFTADKGTYKAKSLWKIWTWFSWSGISFFESTEYPKEAHDWTFFISFIVPQLLFHLLLLLNGSPVYYHFTALALNVWLTFNLTIPFAGSDKDRTLFPQLDKSSHLKWLPRPAWPVAGLMLVFFVLSMVFGIDITGLTFFGLLVGASLLVLPDSVRATAQKVAQNEGNTVEQVDQFQFLGDAVVQEGPSDSVFGGLYGLLSRLEGSAFDMFWAIMRHRHIGNIIGRLRRGRLKTNSPKVLHKEGTSRVFDNPSSTQYSSGGRWLAIFLDTGFILFDRWNRMKEYQFTVRGRVFGFRFSPDGRTASFVSINKMQVLNLESMEITPVQSIGETIMDLQTKSYQGGYSPDGRYLFWTETHDWRNYFYLLDLRTMTPRRIDDDVRRISFSSDGHRIIFERREIFYSWDLRSLDQPSREIASMHKSVRLTPDGSQAIWQENDKTYVLDLLDPYSKPKEYHFPVSSDAQSKIFYEEVEMSPDGHFIAFSTSYATLVLYRSRSALELVWVGPPSQNLKFSLDNKYFARLTNGAVLLNSLDDIEGLVSALGHSDGSLFFSPNGQYLVRIYESSVHIRDLWNEQEMSHRINGSDFQIAFGLDSQRLVIRSEAALHLFNLEDEDDAHAWEGEFIFQMSPDKRTLVFASRGEVYAHDFSKPTDNRVLIELPSGGADDIKFTPDGRHLILSAAGALGSFLLKKTDSSWSRVASIPSQASVSPDGMEVAYGREPHSDEPGVYRIPLDRPEVPKGAPVLWRQVGPIALVAFLLLLAPFLSLVVIGSLANWIFNHETWGHGLGFKYGAKKGTYGRNSLEAIASRSGLRVFWSDEYSMFTHVLTVAFTFVFSSLSMAGLLFLMGGPGYFQWIALGVNVVQSLILFVPMKQWGWSTAESDMDRALSHREHQRRFDGIRAETQYGVLTAVDYSLTPSRDSGFEHDWARVVPDAVIDDIVDKITNRIRYGLVSSRAFDLDPEFRVYNEQGIQIGGPRTITDIINQIREKLGENRQWAFQYLDVYPDDGGYGFNMAHPHVLYYKSKPPLESQRDRDDLVQVHLPTLNQFYGPKPGNAKLIVFKESTITIRLPESDRGTRSKVKDGIESFFAERKIEIDLKWSGDSFEIKRKGVGKGLARNHFSTLLQGQPFVAYDDQGQPGGNGQALINNKGGVSLDRHDPDNPYVVSAPILAGKTGSAAYLDLNSQLIFDSVEALNARQSEESEQKAVDQKAAMLGIDVKKAGEYVKKRDRVQYGASVVFGRPFSGDLGHSVHRWNADVSARTNGHVNLILDTSHGTVGAMFRSQDDPITPDQVEKVNFLRMMIGINRASPFDVSFKRIQMSDGRDGAVVLVAEAEGEGLEIVKKSFYEAGFNIKYKQQKPGGKTKVFIVIGHIGSDELAAMSNEDVNNFKSWLESHHLLDGSLSTKVDEISLNLYKNRTLVHLADHAISLPLGKEMQTPIPELLRHRTIHSFEESAKIQHLQSTELYGIYADVDELADSYGRVPDAVIDKICELLKRGITVGLTSARRLWEIDSFGRLTAYPGGPQIGGMRDMKEVVDQIRSGLGGADWALKNLNIYPDDGFTQFNVAEFDKNPLNIEQSVSFLSLIADGFDYAFQNFLDPFYRYLYENSGIEYNLPELPTVEFNNGAWFLPMPGIINQNIRVPFLDREYYFINLAWSFFKGHPLGLNMKYFDFIWTGSGILIRDSYSGTPVGERHFERRVGGHEFVSTLGPQILKPGSNTRVIFDFSDDFHHEDTLLFRRGPGETKAEAWIRLVDSLQFVSNLDTNNDSNSGGVLVADTPVLWLQVVPAILVALIGLFTPLQSLALALLGLIAIWILNHEVIAHGLGFWFTADKRTYKAKSLWKFWTWFSWSGISLFESTEYSMRTHKATVLNSLVGAFLLSTAILIYTGSPFYYHVASLVLNGWLTWNLTFPIKKWGWTKAESDADRTQGEQELRKKLSTHPFRSLTEVLGFPRGLQNHTYLSDQVDLVAQTPRTEDEMEKIVEEDWGLTGKWDEWKGDILTGRAQAYDVERSQLAGSKELFPRLS